MQLKPQDTTSHPQWQKLTSLTMRALQILEKNHPSPRRAPLAGSRGSPNTPNAQSKPPFPQPSFLQLQCQSSPRAPSTPESRDSVSPMIQTDRPSPHPPNHCRSQKCAPKALRAQNKVTPPPHTHTHQPPCPTLDK